MSSNFVWDSVNNRWVKLKGDSNGNLIGANTLVCSDQSIGSGVIYYVSSGSVWGVNGLTVEGKLRVDGEVHAFGDVEGDGDITGSGELHLH